MRRKSNEKRQRELCRQSLFKAAREDYSRHDGLENATEIVTDISADHLYALMREYYLANVTVGEAACEELKLRTTDQGKCDNSLQMWLAEKRKHLTASNVGSIAKTRASTKVSSTVKKLLYSKFEGNAATQ